LFHVDFDFEVKPATSLRCSGSIGGATEYVYGGKNNAEYLGLLCGYYVIWLVYMV